MSFSEDNHPSDAAEYSSSPGALRIHVEDNVATALRDLSAGETVRVAGVDTAEAVRTVTDVPCGHKLALTDIGEGESVVKYGYSIGRATRDIRRGEHVHVHNLWGERGRADRRREGVTAGGR